MLNLMMVDLVFQVYKDLKSFDDWWDDTDPGPPTPCSECNNKGEFNCSRHGEIYRLNNDPFLGHPDY